MISCGSQSIKVSRRFSELLKFHESIQKSDLSALYGLVLPKFPSKRRTAGKHLIDPALVALRVNDLQEYFTGLSKIPIILTLDVFHESLGIAALAKTDRAVAQLKETLEQCGHLALAATPMTTAAHSGSDGKSSSESSMTSSSSSHSASTSKKSKKKKKPSKKKSSKKNNSKSSHSGDDNDSDSDSDNDGDDDDDDNDNDDSNDSESESAKAALNNDFLYSQKFHLLAKSVVNCSSSSGAPPPSSTEQEQLMKQARVAKEGDLDDNESPAPIPALYFNHALRFHLQPDFWAGDRSIREGPGGRVWFTMVGPIPSVAVGKNPRMNDYYALVNPTSSASPLMFVSISGDGAGGFKSFTIWEAMSDGLVGAAVCTFNYEAPAAGSRDTMGYVMESESGNRQNITCVGTSTRMNTFFQDDVKVCAKVDMARDREDDLVVEVMPHRDVLFYLISVIAIQKLEDGEDDRE